MPRARTLIVIPTFNERDNIVSLCERLLEQNDLDVLVVDDRSPDGTADVLRDLERESGGRLRVMVRDGKGGRGSAVLAGFKQGLAEGYELIFEMDADFSHKPEEIGRFLEASNTADLVIGSRYLPGSEIHDWGWKRTFFSKWANRYARAILRIPISDYTNGFRCYRREAVIALDTDSIDAKGYVVLSEVAYQLHRKGFRIGEVPTVFVNRRRGISNLGLHEVREAFLSILRIRFPRTTAHVEKGVKFAMSGGLGAIIDFSGLFVLQNVFDVDARFAVVLSTLPAIVVVFLMNKYFTFRDTRRNHGTQATKFLLVYGAAFLWNSGLSLLFLALGLPAPIAKACAILCVALWNYILLNSFVFRR